MSLRKNQTIIRLTPSIFKEKHGQVCNNRCKGKKVEQNFKKRKTNDEVYRKHKN